jgi:hypothetical protein
LSDRQEDSVNNVGRRDPTLPRPYEAERVPRIPGRHRECNPEATETIRCHGSGNATEAVWEEGQGDRKRT